MPLLFWFLLNNNKCMFVIFYLYNKGMKAFFLKNSKALEETPIIFPPVLYRLLREQCWGYSVSYAFSAWLCSVFCFKQWKLYILFSFIMSQIFIMMFLYGIFWLLRMAYYKQQIWQIKYLISCEIFSSTIFSILWLNFLY